MNGNREAREQKREREEEKRSKYEENFDNKASS